MNKKYLFVAVPLILGPLFAYAWTSAPSNPPSDNVDAPINQSGAAQSKVGGLLLNTGGATNGLIVQSGNVGIGIPAPGQKLDVAGNVNVSTGSAYMYNGINVIAAQTALDNYFFGKAGNLTMIGARNVAIGPQALANSTEGNNNTASGMQALYSNITGHSNTANGTYALKYNTYGYSNTALGGSALFFTTTGGYNTAVGDNAIAYNTTGTGNTAIGMQALDANTTGSFNTALGYGADVASGALSNATAIGNGAIVNASNKVMIGNTSVTSIGGQVGWSVFSDARLKENVKESLLGLDFILKLKPVEFNYKAVGQKGLTYTGLIAQDVEKALKSLGTDFSALQKPQNENDFYQLRYAEFVAPLIKAVQEQQARIDSQQKQIDELRREIRDLTNGN